MDAGNTALDTHVQLTIPEAVEYGSKDASFFGEFFFPRACRLPTPEFHKDMDKLLDAQNQRLVAFQVFRDGAKTTKTRLYIAKRISYGLSRTILIVGKSESAAVRTVGWISNNVKRNSLWAKAFCLRKGSKWGADEIEILQQFPDEDEPTAVRVIAMGIGGSTRGINVDDYRPDLIVVDDPCDDENTKTKEQRNKTNENFFGALMHSLAPRVESPHAKMVLLQTVLNPDDLISLAMKDGTWASLNIPVFKPDGTSQWPERFPTEDLREEKQGFIDRGMLHTWLREKEGKIVAPGTAAFREQNLQYYDQMPQKGITIVCVDPTPPPRQTVDGTVKETARNDDAVVRVLRLTRDGIYLGPRWSEKSPDEEEIAAQVLAFAQMHGAYHIAVETVLFQRVIGKLIRKKMQETHLYKPVIEIEDRRAKETRIRQEIGSYAGYQRLFVQKNDADFIEQYLRYPDVNHDDHLDAVAIGIMSLENWMLEIDNDALEGEFSREDDIGDDEWDGAP